MSTEQDKQAEPDRPRIRLPNRRHNEIVEIVFRGRDYRLAFTRFPDGRIAAVFCDPSKVASDAAEDSRDVGLLLSLAFQYGIAVQTLASSVSREHGRPTSLSGYVLDVLAAECPPS